MERPILDAGGAGGREEGGFEIRPLRTLDELRRCVALQEVVWGDGFSERVPTAILNVARRLGGVVSGAFDREGELAGFVFGLTGIEGGEPVHWSDMLAVRPEHRNAGLGTRLKLHQRRQLLDAGIRKIYWTFDPLESRNAYLNLVHLGAVAREYVVDMYGGSSSPLHAGLGTDRLVAVWLLDSPRVEERVRELEAAPGARSFERSPGKGRGEGPEAGAGASEPDAGADASEPDGGHGRAQGDVAPDAERSDLALQAREAAHALEAEEGARGPRPTRPALGLDAPFLTVALPADIQALKERDGALARQWRESTREALAHYLERGWEVRELVRAGEVSRYLLVR